MGEEADELIKFDHWCDLPGMVEPPERRSPGGALVERTSPAQSLTVEAGGPLAVGYREIEPAMWVQRVPPDQGVGAAGPAPLTVSSLDRAGVEQFANAQGGRSGLPGGGVSTLGDHDERLLRGEQRVKESLTSHVTASVAPVVLAATGTPGQQVVTVNTRGSREDGIVQAQDTDDSRLYGGQVIECGEQQGAVAVVGAPAGRVHPVAQPHLEIGRGQKNLLGVCLVLQVGQFSQSVAQLPVIAKGHLDEQVDGLPESRDPLGGRGRDIESLADLADSRHQFGELTHQFGVGSADPRHRGDRGQMHRGLVAQRQAQLEPLHARQPGGLQHLHPVAPTLISIDPPPDLSGGHQFVQPVKLLGTESESLGDRGGLTQVDQIDTGCPTAVQVEDPGQHSQHRIGSGQCRRRQLGSQPVPGVQVVVRRQQNEAAIRGAYCASAGHSTTTSRGCRDGSSENRPHSTSLNTSTCRSGPWQACTWKEWSARCRPSGARSWRISCCTRANRVRAGGPGSGSSTAARLA